MLGKHNAASFGTGDINLAAAVLTMGVRPDPLEPVKLIAHENGNDYVRFHVLGLSDDGAHETNQLMLAWSDPHGFAAENPNHPFCTVMDFIRARPAWCNTKDDWLSHAADWLELTDNAIRKTYRDIEATTATAPESPVSYVVAFVRNRFDLIAAAKRTQAKGRVKNFMSEGKAVALISDKAPRRIKDFLLSHLR